ncbi:hypothetical protein XBKQ1_270001 [Xenorhabdus bovienii str. kraussei Quebec]|uniref:vWA found in TerF C terminus domain-containing protein n=1 Tax=Xenorhabdus bovienii str. kraussei Quebec TaxID=1398203 RepID=A0A077PIR4_XENBV|nr:VWA domain-containing protein [Xenorhabdus bovienii]CDH20616.1 hypothetical protein XBKQ1_270001 [Xenorhabdus bovienii str. kraussei Quebec]
MELQAGQNTVLSTTSLRLTLSYPATSSFCSEVDASIFLLNSSGKVMEEVIDFFNDSNLPVYVVFITDGGISKTRQIKDAIRRSANYPIFWKFVGLGGSNYGVLEDLDNFTDRRLDNTHFFAIDNFATVKEDQLYDLLLKDFKDWHDAATTERIL